VSVLLERYLLDTKPLAAYLFDRPLAVALLRPLIVAERASPSMLCYGEVVEYIRGLPPARRRQRALRGLMHLVRPHPVTYRVMDGYADLRRRLRPPHGPGSIGDIDTLIAATALDRGLTLVTTDTDFNRVPGLNALVVSRLR